jgi:hypothetical protein
MQFTRIAAFIGMLALVAAAAIPVADSSDFAVKREEFYDCTDVCRIYTRIAPFSIPVLTVVQACP